MDSAGYQKEPQEGKPPVDNTPTNWFELAVELCHGGHITETRMRRAMDAVKKAVDRE